MPLEENGSTMRIAQFKTALIASSSLILVSLAGATPAQSQSFKNMSASEKEAFMDVLKEVLVEHPEILQAGFDALYQKKIDDLRAEMETPYGGYSIGPDDAPIVITEYFDYRCGYCKRSMSWLFSTQQNDPQIRIVLKELPVLSTASYDTALTALASKKQGKYVRFHQDLMKARGAFDTEFVNDIAEKAGLDVKQLNEDAKSKEILAELTHSQTLAAKLEINGTPAFFVNGKRVGVGFDPNKIQTAIAAEKKRLGVE